MKERFWARGSPLLILQFCLHFESCVQIQCPWIRLAKWCFAGREGDIGSKWYTWLIPINATCLIKWLKEDNIKYKISGQKPCLSVISLCYGLNSVSPKLIFWSLNPQCDGICVWGLCEIIRFKWGRKHGALIQWDWCHYKRRRRHKRVHREKMRAQQGGSYLQARKRALTKIEFTVTLIMDFWPPELWEINFCWLRHPTCGILLWQHRQTKLIHPPTQISYHKTSVQYLPAYSSVFSVPFSPSIYCTPRY